MKKQTPGCPWFSDMPVDLEKLRAYYETMLTAQFGYVEAQLIKGNCAEDLWQSFGRAWVKLSRVPADHQPNSPDLERYRSYLVDRLSDQVGFTGSTLPGDNFPAVYAAYAAVFANLAT
jgi:hypothetical protein